MITVFLPSDRIIKFARGLLRLVVIERETVLAWWIDFEMGRGMERGKERRRKKVWGGDTGRNGFGKAARDGRHA